jgi:hypothetical protein
MQTTIAPHLASTYDLIQRSFPLGIDEVLYLPLLTVLGAEMSDRVLAQVIADLTGKAYGKVLNDVYGVAASPVVGQAIDRVMQQLQNHGHNEWLNEI